MCIRAGLLLVWTSKPEYWNEAEVDGASLTCQQVLRNGLSKAVDLIFGATQAENFKKYNNN